MMEGGNKFQMYNKTSKPHVTKTVLSSQIFWWHISDGITESGCYYDVIVTLNVKQVSAGRCVQVVTNLSTFWLQFSSGCWPLCPEVDENWNKWKPQHFVGCLYILFEATKLATFVFLLFHFLSFTYLVILFKVRTV